MLARPGICATIRRESACNTRCLFTHMIDVKPYDDLDLPNGVPQAPRRWYAGTCHHLFDGGWLWVIPFDNREGSTNKCVSVGLSFDIRKFPKPMDITPDEEWQSLPRHVPQHRRAVQGRQTGPRLGVV